MLFPHTFDCYVLRVASLIKMILTGEVEGWQRFTSVGLYAYKCEGLYYRPGFKIQALCRQIYLMTDLKQLITAVANNFFPATAD